MTSLHETALNGLGITEVQLSLMIKGQQESGKQLEAALLMEIGVLLADLTSAETSQRGAAQSLASATAAFQDNPTVDRAESMVHYAQRVQKYTLEAQNAYKAIGKAWRLFKMATES